MSKENVFKQITARGRKIDLKVTWVWFFEHAHFWLAAIFDVKAFLVFSKCWIYPETETSDLISHSILTNRQATADRDLFHLFESWFWAFFFLLIQCSLSLLECCVLQMAFNFHTLNWAPMISVSERRVNSGHHHLLIMRFWTIMSKAFQHFNKTNYGTLCKNVMRNSSVMLLWWVVLTQHGISSVRFKNKHVQSNEVGSVK